MGKKCSSVAGEYDEVEDDEEEEEKGSNEEQEENGRKWKCQQVGVSPNKRRVGARGVHAEDEEDDGKKLVQCVSDISQCMKSLVSQKT